RTGGAALPADVLAGHEPHRAGVVAAARGRHPQPPLPHDGGTPRPDVRLVRDSHPLPGPVQCVHEMPWKMSITSAFGGRYLDNDDGDVERAVVLRGERVIDPGEQMSVAGRLFVIDHAPRIVNGVPVPGWVEVRVEQEGTSRGGDRPGSTDGGPGAGGGGGRHARGSRVRGPSTGPL